MWPDLQLIAVAYLTDVLGLRVATTTPANLEDQMPMVRVRRGPGSDDGVTDAPLLDVETFAGTDRGAWDLAEQARQAIHGLGGKAVNGALVDSVTTAQSPVNVDWENPAVERYVASYRVTFRQ